MDAEIEWCSMLTCIRFVEEALVLKRKSWKAKLR